MRLGSLTARARREVRQRRPPACPHGWSSGPPIFVGVGAQRSRTTSWHHRTITRNQSKTVEATLPQHEHATIVRAYQCEVDRLPDLVPDFDRSLWPHFAQ
jgi:hypothetical protein